MSAERGNITAAKVRSRICIRWKTDEMILELIECPLIRNQRLLGVTTFILSAGNYGRKIKKYRSHM